MSDQHTSWLGKLGNLLVPSRQAAPRVPPVTNTRILEELVACFQDSLRRESVGTSMLFNAHFLIILHPGTYEERQNAFPVIVNEAVDAFRAIIEKHRAEYDRIAPVASHWFFKFGGGREFNGEPIDPADVQVVGTLTGIVPGSGWVESPDKVNVTRRVKQTNRFEKVDIDPNTFQNITFREPGAFVVKFAFNPSPAPNASAPRVGSAAQSAPQLPPGFGEGLARIEYHIAELNRENTYLMCDREIVVARKEPDNQHFPNYLLLESAYVSNPHLRIRYNDSSRTFQIASFSRNETRLNERLIPRSEPTNPQWHPLPDKAQILLNSMVTLHFQANT